MISNPLIGLYNRDMANVLDILRYLRIKNECQIDH